MNGNGGHPGPLLCVPALVCLYALISPVLSVEPLKDFHCNRRAGES